MKEIDNELIWKSLVGNIQAVDLCLAKHADIHAANDLALANAVHMNHIEVVKLLLRHGANINNRKRPAIIHAGSKNMIELLLKNGANISFTKHYRCNKLLRQVRDHHALVG